jgi:hypothetical protein
LFPEGNQRKRNKPAFALTELRRGEGRNNQKIEQNSAERRFLFDKNIILIYFKRGLVFKKRRKYGKEVR